MMKLTQERLGALMRDNFGGTIKIGGEQESIIVIEIPFGVHTAEQTYNNLLSLTNEEGAYKRLLLECRDEETIKEYKRESA